MTQPKELFRESITDCVYESLQEANEQALNSAIDNLYCSLKSNRNNGCVYSDELNKERLDEITSRCNNLLALFKNPQAFTSRYVKK